MIILSAVIIRKEKLLVDDKDMEHDVTFHFFILLQVNKNKKSLRFTLFYFGEQTTLVML